MEVKGKIKLINGIQTFGVNDFRKRELVVTTNEQYPQMIMVEFHKDKTDLLNAYKVGDNVSVSINLRGREWINPQGEAKYFNSLIGWRIEKVEDATSELPSTEQFEPVASGNDSEHDDDLPF